MYHNAPPISSLGPVMNQQSHGGGSSSGGNNNWDQSQRMRGKIRYGSRSNNNRNSRNNNSNNSSSHGHGHGHGHGHNSGHGYDNGSQQMGLSVNNTGGGGNIPSIGMMSGGKGNAANGNTSPRGSQEAARRGSRRQQRNAGGGGGGNVGAGGSIYYDPNAGSGGDNLNSTQIGGGMGSPDKRGQQQQLLPRIGSSNNNSNSMNSRGKLGGGGGGGNTQQMNSSGQQGTTTMQLSSILQNNNMNASGGGQSGQGSNMPNLYGGGARNSPGSTMLGSGGGAQRNISSGVSTIKGYKPSNPLNWINQDNYFVLENVPHGANPSSSSSHGGITTNNIYCCLDGHGEHGHIVSKRISELLPQIMTSKACTLASNSNVSGNSSSAGGAAGSINYYYDFKKAFLATQADLTNNTHTVVDASCSGATCIMVTINPADGVVLICNCGDSRAIIGSSKRSLNATSSSHANSNVMNYVATALSYDHKPDRPDERKRIQQSNGRVGCRQMTVPNTNRVSVQSASGGTTIPSMISVPVGPCRVWYSYKGDTLGLAMSRSLGDCVVHTCGVSAEPEIVVYRLNSTDVVSNNNSGGNNSNSFHMVDEFIVLATDGIWDVLDNNTVVNLVVQNFVNPAAQQQQFGTYPQWSAADAAAFLTKTARAKWEKLSPMIDDITCIVVKLV